MKPFLNRESDCFACLCETFSALSTEKLRTRIVNVPSDTTSNAGQIFSTHHDNPGKNPWWSFTAVVENFIRNLKALNHHDLLNKIHPLHDYLSFNIRRLRFPTRSARLFQMKFWLSDLLLVSCNKRLHPDHPLKQSGRLTIDHPLRFMWSIFVAWRIILLCGSRRS